MPPVLSPTPPDTPAPAAFTAGPAVAPGLLAGCILGGIGKLMHAAGSCACLRCAVCMLSHTIIELAFVPRQAAFFVRQVGAHHGPTLLLCMTCRAAPCSLPCGPGFLCSAPGQGLAAQADGCRQAGAKRRLAWGRNRQLPHSAAPKLWQLAACDPTIQLRHHSQPLCLPAYCRYTICQASRPREPVLAACCLQQQQGA